MMKSFIEKWWFIIVVTSKMNQMPSVVYALLVGLTFAGINFGTTDTGEPGCSWMDRSSGVDEKLGGASD